MASEEQVVPVEVPVEIRADAQVEVTAKRSLEPSPSREAPAAKRQTTGPKERSQAKDKRYGKGEYKQWDKEPQRVAKPLKDGEEKQARLPKKKTAVLIG